MKAFLLLLTLNFWTLFLHAQQTQRLEENKSIFINGIELGYRINKESTKKSGNEEYSRYVLSLYAVNNSECSRYYYFRNDFYSAYGSNDDNLVATFYVRNANGKRLTSTSGTVTAKDWWVPVRVSERDGNGREVYRTRQMLAGYVFRRGDQLESQIIVLVPQGDVPSVEVALRYYVEQF